MASISSSKSMSNLTLNRRITQKDIAKAANVSQALVSHILNGVAKGEVSPEKEQRVLVAAEALGYKTRRKASGEKKKRRVLGCVYPQVARLDGIEEWLFKSHEDFYHRIRVYLEEAAKVRGFTVVAHAGSDSEELSEWIREYQVEGVFWCVSDNECARRIMAKVPLVQVARRMLTDVDAALGDSAEMVNISLQHLAERGHRHIAYISKNKKEEYQARLRVRAYEDFMAARGLPLLYLDEADVNLQGLDDTIARLRGERLPVKPTALLAPDCHALLLQRRLLQEGGRLPEDFSIVGIDNLSACDFTHPALTSVDCEPREVADSAVYLMETRLEKPDAPARKIEVCPRLIERESVAYLSAQHAISL